VAWFWADSVGCGKCDCDRCLYRWQGRCPHGGCYDDYMAKTKPYDKWASENRQDYIEWGKLQPDGIPIWRKSWTNWNRPGEQRHWCRGASFWAQTGECEHFVEYKADETQCLECLESLITKYQDGYIHCSLLDCQGCEECYRRFNERLEKME